MTHVVAFETHYTAAPTSAVGGIVTVQDQPPLSIVPPRLKRHEETKANASRSTGEPQALGQILQLLVPRSMDSTYSGNATFGGLKTPWTAAKKIEGQNSNPMLAIYRLTSASTSQEAVLLTWPTRHSSTTQLNGYEPYEASDWDGYGAEPIMPQTISAARDLLGIVPKGRFTDLVEHSPGADGSIGFEWLMSEGPLRKLFIDIGPGSTWKAYWRLASGETGTVPRKKFSLTTLKELADLFARLGA